MIRELVGTNLVPPERYFRWRGGEISSRKRRLALNEYEALRTRHDMIGYAVIAGVGLLVAVTAQLLPVRRSFLSVFLLPLSALYGLLAKRIFRKQESLALKRERAASGRASTF
ncbi:MAG TPA: hypothetical protein VIX19_04965 [Terriglobales bacterium]